MKKKLNNKYNLYYLIISLVLIITSILIYRYYNTIEKFKPIDDHPDIIFYSYGNEYKKFNKLIDSAIENNVNIIVKGIGIKWLDFSTKLKNFHKFIETVDDNKIVMCIDGYDVMIFDNAENMKIKFEEFNKPLVFSCEIHCGPDPEIAKHYPQDINEKFKYLNAGTYMGYAWKIKEMLNYIRDSENYNCKTYHTNKEHDKADDQRCLQKYYLNNMNDIALDYKQKIWSVTLGTGRQDYEIVKYSRLFNKLTNEKSSILHFNGWMEWYRDL